MSNYKQSSSLLAGLLTFIFCSALNAHEEEVIREYSFDIREINEIDIQGSVGEMHVVMAPGNTLKVVLTITGTERHWFRKAPDVSEVDLISRVRNGKLFLQQEEKDTHTHWEIELPQTAATSLELGVGSINGDFSATTLELDVGVGEIDIRYPLESAGEIEVNVGVGGASVHGAESISTRRAFISQDIEATGPGDLELDLEVGVGDARLRLM